MSKKLMCACPPRESCYEEGCNGCTGAERDPTRLKTETEIRELLRKAIETLRTGDHQNASYFVGYRRALIEVLGEDIGFPEYYPHEYPAVGTCHLCSKPIYGGDATEPFNIGGDPVQVHWHCMRKKEELEDEEAEGDAILSSMGMDRYGSLPSED